MSSARDRKNDGENRRSILEKKVDGGLSEVDLYKIERQETDEEEDDDQE